MSGGRHHPEREEGIMTIPHGPIHKTGRAELADRDADLTVRIVLWVVAGLSAIAMAVWWIAT